MKLEHSLEFNEINLCFLSLQEAEVITGILGSIDCNGQERSVRYRTFDAELLKLEENFMTEHQYGSFSSESYLLGLIFFFILS